MLNSYADTNRVIFFPKLWNGKFIFCLGRTFDLVFEALFTIEMISMLSAHILYQPQILSDHSQEEEHPSLDLLVVWTLESQTRHMPWFLHQDNSTSLPCVP